MAAFHSVASLARGCEATEVEGSETEKRTQSFLTKRSKNNLSDVINKMSSPPPNDGVLDAFRHGWTLHAALPHKGPWESVHTSIAG
jgi:hypothetical protein